jgi:hypothetical protein
MESMPFLHANNIFTITFEDDLAFVEVRSILDQLLRLDAFNPTTQELEDFYSLACEENFFRVWVSEMEVIIQKRHLES